MLRYGTLLAIELLILVFSLSGVSSYHSYQALEVKEHKSSTIIASVYDFLKDNRVAIVEPVIIPEPRPELQKSKVVTISRGADLSIIKNFEVTWYNDRGTTKSGRKTLDGVTVAVDPRVIPLGTWLLIHMPDGTILKRRADDTGGAVQGKVLDIYSNTPREELLKRGRTKGVIVKILEGGM